MSHVGLSDEMVDAVDRDDVDRVTALLDAGADVNARNEHGETAFSLACANNSLAVAKHLFARGADSNTVDAGGGSPLDWAVCWSSPEFREWLASVGGRRNDVSYEPWPWPPKCTDNSSRFQLDRQPRREVVAPYSRFDATARFWIAVFAGTAFGGGVLGLIQAGPLGAFVGTMFAFGFAVPVCGSAAILAWAFWIDRFRVSAAVASGAASGLICTAQMGDILYALPIVESFVLAAILGGLGAGLAANWFVRNTDTGRWLTANSNASPRTFSLGEMFIHFTVVTLVIACWTGAIGVLHLRDEARWRIPPGIDMRHRAD